MRASLNQQSLRLVGVAAAVVVLSLAASPVRADETSYGAFVDSQLLFDVETAVAWGGGIDVNFGMTYFKFALAFSDYYWDTDLAFGLGPTFEFGKLLAVPLRIGAIYKFIYFMPGSDRPEGVLFPVGVANNDAVSALGLEAGAALELKLGKRKKDSPRVFLGADFQVFNGVAYMSTHDVGWLTALNIVAGMRFF